MREKARRGFKVPFPPSQPRSLWLEPCWPHVVCLTFAPLARRPRTVAELKILLSQRFMEAVFPKAAAETTDGGQGPVSEASAKEADGQPKGEHPAPVPVEAEVEMARLKARVAEALAGRKEAEAALAAANERSARSELERRIRAAAQDMIVKDIAAGISDAATAAALVTLLQSAPEEQLEASVLPLKG